MKYGSFWWMFQPRSRGSTTLCPRLEIGKSSLKPCNSPSTIAAPSANGFNRSVYTSNGYAVLIPDITYRVNDPGLSSVECILPALDAPAVADVYKWNNVTPRVGITQCAELPLRYVIAGNRL